MIRYILGAIITLFSLQIFWPRNELNVLYTPKVYIKRIPQIDYDTIAIAPKTDTIYKDSIAYTIPVFSYTFRESLPFIYNKKECQYYFLFGLKGYVREYSFTPQPLTLLASKPQREILYWKIGCFTLGLTTIGLTYLLLRDK